MPVGNACSKSLTAVRDLIPKSQLVIIGDFFVSDPVVSEGDDVYEINLTNNDLKNRNCNQMEPWMLPDTEIMFLKCIAGNDSTSLEKFIVFANKNHWLGGKRIFLDLDKGKTIVNRQTKLVLHNSNPLNALNYKMSHSLKKTNFILEEWPYSNINQLLLPNDNDDLAPWMRSKNKKVNPQHSKSNNMSITALKAVALTMPKNVPFLLHQQEQQRQHNQQTQQEQQRQHNQQTQQEQQRQHNQKTQQEQPKQHNQQTQQEQQRQHTQQTQQEQQRQHNQQTQQQQHLQQQQQQNHHQQQQQQQQSNTFFSMSFQPMFVYGRPVPMMSFLPNFAYRSWPIDFQQQLPATYVSQPPKPAPQHILWNAQPTRTNSLSSTTEAAIR